MGFNIGHNSLGRQTSRGRHIKGSALGRLGFCTRWAVDRYGTGAGWVEIIEVDLRLPRLPQKLRGLRIAHISDLHYSRTVSGVYLYRCIERVNRLHPDLVALTGDYITYDFRGRYREKVAALLGRLRSRLGVYACLGNHDYGMRRLPAAQRASLIAELTGGMQTAGITVLRNESAKVTVQGQGFWLVGLGDLWVDDFRPGDAFSRIPEDGTALALVHNPLGVNYLSDYPVQAVLSGHTHGSRTSPSGPLSWAGRDGRYYAGLYDVGGIKLYVNRGLGRLGWAPLHARPEITILTLR